MRLSSQPHRRARARARAALVCVKTIVTYVEAQREQAEEGGGHRALGASCEGERGRPMSVSAAAASLSHYGEIKKMAGRRAEGPLMERVRERRRGIGVMECWMERGRRGAVMSVCSQCK